MISYFLQKNLNKVNCDIFNKKYYDKIKYILRPVNVDQACFEVSSSYMRIPNDQISLLVETLSSTRYSKALHLSEKPPVNVFFVLPYVKLLVNPKSVIFALSFESNNTFYIFISQWTRF